MMRTFCDDGDAEMFCEIPRRIVGQVLVDEAGLRNISLPHLHTIFPPPLLATVDGWISHPPFLHSQLLVQILQPLPSK